MIDTWQLIALLLGWGSQAAHAWRMNKQDERQEARKAHRLDELERTVEALVHDRDELRRRFETLMSLTKALHDDETIKAALETIR